MLKLKLIAILIFSIAVLQPSFSQQLKLKDNNAYFSKKTITSDSTGKQKDLELLLNFGIGLDPSAYVGYNTGVTINFRNVVDFRIGYEGYNNMSPGGSTGYSMFTASIYNGGYRYKDKLRIAIGAGVGVLVALPDYFNKSTVYPFISFKTDYFLGKIFGLGGEIRFNFNKLYSHSSALFFLNFNFRI
ncbi:MAG: hypothetical protein EHM58_14130 [Ignavibacteriae bacterium]|nr:MAG: hypothetical protein EHM58_14130 [Ignavibacteriota bacterium]